ncbi:MAG TPA: hypothetical protein VF815_19050 [Myxococcaceae bacterium]|jgi:hypothetical protein
MMGAPPDDPQVLERRAEEVRHWSEVFNKIQKGEASEEEIHGYYGYLRQVSEDFISLASAMLTKHGERLPDQDRGLLALSIELHHARLKAIPRQTDEALVRRRLQAQRRKNTLN